MLCLVQLEQEKADTKYMLDTGLDMSTVKEQLDKLRIKQRELNRTKTEATAKRQQGHDELQDAKAKHSDLNSQCTTVKNKGEAHISLPLPVTFGQPACDFLYVHLVNKGENSLSTDGH